LLHKYKSLSLRIHPGKRLLDAIVDLPFALPTAVAGIALSAIYAENGWHPRMPRVEVDRLGEIRVGARIYPINTCDISQGGVRLEIDHPLKVGDNIVLTLEKWRSIDGTVCWYDQGQGGIAFNQVIPFQELMGWLGNC
jgi:hypothetical protein